VRFGQSQYVLPVGDSLTLELRGEGVEQLGGWQAQVAFAPAVVELSQATQGSFLVASGRSVGSLGPETLGAGQVALGAFSYGSPAAVSGAGALAHLRFRGLAAGSTMFDLSDVILASVSGAEVSSQPTAVQGAEIVVVAVLPVAISTAGGQLRLGWTAPTSPPHFQVWRNPDPYFDPSGLGAELAAEDGSVACAVVGAAVTCAFAAGLDDPGRNDFYVVRAFDAAGQPLGQSFRLGEFDFRLTPGS
jgi:hypothetical protein